MSKQGIQGRHGILFIHAPSVKQATGGVYGGGSDLYDSLEKATTAFVAICERAHTPASERPIFVDGSFGTRLEDRVISNHDRVELVTRRGKVLAEMIPITAEKYAYDRAWLHAAHTRQAALETNPVRARIWLKLAGRFA